MVNIGFEFCILQLNVMDTAGELFYCMDPYHYCVNMLRFLEGGHYGFAILPAQSVQIIRNCLFLAIFS